MRYQVSYEVITHDSDDWQTEKKPFEAVDDAHAKRLGGSLVNDRVKQIRRGGSAVEVRRIEVRRIVETLSDPI